MAPMMSTCSVSSTPSCASRWSWPITPPRLRVTDCTRRSGSSPKIDWQMPASVSRTPCTSTPQHFGRRAVAEWGNWNGPGWRDAVDWVELELGNLRAGLPVERERGQMEVATDIAAHAALMGFSVQLFETLAWAEELLDAATDGRRPSTPPPVHGGRLCVLRRAARRGPSERPPGDRLEDDDRYDPCEPGTRCSSRRSARCTAATSTATSS